MYETNFILKLSNKENTGGSVKNISAKVKLNKTIHGAKFFELRAFAQINKTMAIKCNLVDESYNFFCEDSENVHRTNVFLVTNYFFSKDFFKVRISNSKSLINEFWIEMELLSKKSFTQKEMEEMFVYLVIYHTEP